MRKAHHDRSTKGARGTDSLLRVRSWVYMAGLAGALSMLAAPSAMADSKDGIFPTADQVGGEVFPNATKPGDKFPTDITLYDESGKEMKLADVMKNKRTIVAFFITAVPTSVDEIKKLEQFVSADGLDVDLLLLNADTVGTALFGGPSQAIPATVQTVKFVKGEVGLKNPIYVAPNDALNPKGLSNRIGFRGLPTVFIVAADGTVEKVFVGPQQWKKGDI